MTGYEVVWSGDLHRSILPDAEILAIRARAAQLEPPSVRQSRQQEARRREYLASQARVHARVQAVCADEWRSVEDVRRLTGLSVSRSVRALNALVQRRQLIATPREA